LLSQAVAREKRRVDRNFSYVRYQWFEWTFL